MKERMNLYDLSVMEVLSLACALIRTIDRHAGLALLLDRRPSPITDARPSAVIVATLAAIEHVDPEGGGGEGAVLQAEELLNSLGVETG